MMKTPQVAVVGLGVMGKSLARNIHSRGYSTGVYNRTTSVTEEFLQEFGTSGFVTAHTMSELVSKLEFPRQIILMIPAGRAVDAVLGDLLPLLAPGDIVIDGGNAYYEDTARRERDCAERGISFLGVGISGGEEGALTGPSIMPGGPREAWETVSPLLEEIAAQADGPCTAYIGPGGAGHFVKMVHNGIEYADMQLIAESYDLLRKCGGFAPPRLAEIFTEWNGGELSSFLMEITSKIFLHRDSETDGFLVDIILDAAAQKGTGRWTAQEALNLNVAVPVITAAVDARIISSDASARKMFTDWPGGKEKIEPIPQAEEAAFIDAVRGALFACKIVCYAQGFDLISSASKKFDWGIDNAELARIWKGGCIIRAKVLDDIQRALASAPPQAHLLSDSGLASEVRSRQPQLRQIIALGVRQGVPLPAFSAALAYIDAYSSERLPQNLVQAQRDFFGAHTFQRLDREGAFHHEWE